MYQEILTYLDNILIRRNFIKDLPYNPQLKHLARENRKAGILAEVLFWQQVHKRTFFNIDFDRQRIIGNYIVDFYVKALGLVVEIDGNSHNYKQKEDLLRDEFLESLDLKVLRLTDKDVLQNVGGVMENVKRFIVLHYSI